MPVDKGTDVSDVYDGGKEVPCVENVAVSADVFFNVARLNSGCGTHSHEEPFDER